MKLTKMSQLALLLGVALLFLGLWAGAAPVLGSGNRLLGGIDERFFLHGAPFAMIGCWGENLDCYLHCVGTRWSYCSNAYASWGTKLNCTGGSVLTAIPQAAGGGQAYPTAEAGCEGLASCGEIYHAACTY